MSLNKIMTNFGIQNKFLNLWGLKSRQAIVPNIAIDRSSININDPF